MAILYVTEDLAKWGAGVDRELFAAEIDLNFWDVDSRLTDLEINPPTPIEIEDIQVVGTQMTIYMEGGGTFGPFTLPVATMHFQGAWATSTSYTENDLVSHPETGGLYLVLQDHSTTGVTTFDPDAQSGGFDLYFQIIPGVIASYDVPFKIGATSPSAGEVIGIFPVPANRTIRFGADFTDANEYVGTPPDADYPIDVEVDAVVIGTVTLHTGGTITYATDSNEAQAVSGPAVILIRAPDQGGAQDTSIANVVVTLAADLIPALV